MTAETQAARDELLPERDSMIEQAALSVALPRQVETLREEQQRVHASTESMRRRFGSCSSSRRSRSEQPLHGEVGLVDDLTSRLSNATD